MRKKIGSLMLICSIIVFFINGTMISYASTETNLESGEDLLSFNIETKEETIISKEAIEKKVTEMRNEKSNLLTDNYMVKGCQPFSEETQISPNSIIGENDEREPVEPDPRICEVLSIYLIGGEWVTIRGTGFMISKDVLLTAAHCIMMPHPDYNNVRNYPTEFIVSPGVSEDENGNYVYKYGRLTNDDILDGTVPMVYSQSGDPSHDWGVLTFKHDVGVGWMDWGTWGASGDDLVGKEVFVQGYDNEQFPLIQRLSSGFCLDHAGFSCVHTADTAHGTSGAPVWTSDGKVIGIHNLGLGSYFFPSMNGAVGITLSRYNSLISIIDDPTLKSFDQLNA